MNNRTLIPLIAAFIVLLLSAALYGFGYYQLTKLTQKASALSDDIATKSVALAHAAEARAALATLSGDEATLSQYTIRKEDVVPFLEALQATGTSLGSNVEVASVSDDKSSTHSRIALALTISGSFDSVLRTLGAIEYGPYDAVVSSVTLDTTAGDAKTATKWTASTLLSVGTRSSTSTPQQAP